MSSPPFLDTRRRPASKAAIHFNVLVPFELTRLAVPHLLERPERRSSTSARKRHWLQCGARWPTTRPRPPSRNSRRRWQPTSDRASGRTRSFPAPSRPRRCAATSTRRTTSRRFTLAEHTRLKRLGTPDDVASAAIFLSSPAASWITGLLLELDGWHDRRDQIRSTPTSDDPLTEASRGREVRHARTHGRQEGAGGGRRPLRTSCSASAGRSPPASHAGRRGVRGRLVEARVQSTVDRSPAKAASAHLIVADVSSRATARGSFVKPRGDGSHRRAGERRRRQPQRRHSAHLREASWHQIMDTNVRAQWLTCRAVIPIMQERVVGRSPTSRRRVEERRREALRYGMSKASVNALTHFIAASYAPWSIRCNAVLPSSSRRPTGSRGSKKPAWLSNEEEYFKIGRREGGTARPNGRCA